MRKFTAQELRRFLVAVDGALKGPAEVVVIGGSAAALRYGVTSTTKDVDTFNRVSPELARAVEQAQDETGLSIPFGKSAQAEPPYNFEDRLQPAMPELERLVVKIPERHDLALMKMLRGYKHDLDTIAAIHEQSPLDLETLITR